MRTRRPRPLDDGGINATTLSGHLPQETPRDRLAGDLGPAGPIAAGGFEPPTLGL
jgi:hypothetical protein